MVKNGLQSDVVSDISLSLIVESLSEVHLYKKIWMSLVDSM
jgi:hypothetical protein